MKIQIIKFLDYIKLIGITYLILKFKKIIKLVKSKKAKRLMICSTKSMTNYILKHKNVFLNENLN